MNVANHRPINGALAFEPRALTASLLEELQRLIDEPSVGSRGQRDLPEELEGFFSTISLESEATLAGDEPDGQPVQLPSSVTPLSIGRFQIESLLGSGGFGMVFRAYDPKLQRQVALKILRPEAALSAGIRRRFLREAKSAAQLEHPGIISVYEAGRYAGLSYLAAPWVDGPNLATWLAEHPAELTPRQSALLIAQVAEAVQHAHLRGILHRDLKPSNILLRSNSTTAKSDLPFEPLLTDFGLAGRTDGPVEETCPGMVLGTSAYMSPEQAAGQWTNVGVGSDVYSLGVILYELLTGTRPPPASANLAAHSAPVPPRRICPAIPRDLETICLKALAEVPSQRYTTAGELAADLRRLLAHQPIQARHATLARQVWLACLRRPVVASLTAVLAVTVLVSTVTTAFLYQAERAERARSEQSLDFARKAVSDMYTKVADKWLLNQPEVQGLRRELLEDALRFYEVIAAQQPRDERSRHDLSVALHRMANITSQLQRPEKCVRYRERCLEIVDALVIEHPANEQYQYDAFLNRMRIAAEYGSVGHPERAMPTLLEAEKRIRRLNQLSPSKPAYRDALAALCNEIAWRVDEAATEKWSTEAAEISEALVAEIPERLLYGKHAVLANFRLASIYFGQNKRDQAQERFARAETFLNEARAKLPGEIWVDELSCTVYGYGSCLLKVGEAEAAIPLLQISREASTRLGDKFPQSLGHRILRAEISLQLADAYLQLDRHAEAQGTLESAAADVKHVLSQTPMDQAAQKLQRTIAAKMQATQPEPSSPPLSQ